MTDDLDRCRLLLASASVLPLGRALEVLEPFRCGLAEAERLFRLENAPLPPEAPAGLAAWWRAEVRYSAATPGGAAYEHAYEDLQLHRRALAKLLVASAEALAGGPR